MSGENDSVFGKFLFPRIFRTFRLAIQPNKLIIGFLALTVICVTGWMMDNCSNSVIVAPGPGTHDMSAARQKGVTELDIYLSQPKQLDAHVKQFRHSGQRVGVFSTMWNFAFKQFHAFLYSLLALDIAAAAQSAGSYIRGLGWLVKYHYLYCVIFVVIKLAVLAIAAGALCRITALQFARDEKPSLSEALGYSTRRFVSFFAAPLAPLGIILFLGVLILILGLLTNIPWAGELILAVFNVLALIAGALIAFFLIGTVAGFNLMFPAVAFDGADCFDAISRAFSYVYSRPWRMGFYTCVAAIYGGACYLFVRFFAFVLLWSSHRFLQLGIWADNSSKQVNKLAAIWPEPSFMNLFGTTSGASLNWSESIAAFLIYLLVLVVIGLVIAFIISFYFSANTVIYALMRNRVDNTDLEEIYSEETTGEPVESEPAAVETPPEPMEEKAEATEEAADASEERSEAAEKKVEPTEDQGPSDPEIQPKPSSETQ